MSVVFKAGAGLMAGAAAGLLGFCFWPRVEPSVMATRPAVEKPVFVVASTAAAAPAPAALVVDAQPAPPDKSGIDKLAAALKATPPAPPAASPSTPAPAPTEEAARFFANGLVSLASGDIASARLFLKRAADSGDARALMALGDSYDASTLARLGAVGMRGDETRARDFYAQALAAGVDAAKERIAALEARGN